MKSTGKVLVLGGDNRSALSVIRSLGRQGIEAHAAWIPPAFPLLRSRHLTKIHDLPLPSTGDSRWMDELKNVVSREGFELVIPCDDPSLIPLVENRTEIEPLVRMAVPSDAAYAVMFDKTATAKLAADLGIPLPVGRVVTEPCDGASALRECGLPVVLKPHASFSGGDLTNRGRVHKARSSEEAEELLRMILRQGPVLVQENVLGRGVGVEVLAAEGEILLAFQHERLHEPLQGGGSSYRRSVPLNSNLLDAASRLMSALSHTGVAMVEFKLNAETGAWWLMEINGRFWGSLPLAIAAGADFPAHLHRLLVHGDRTAPPSYRVGIHCRNWRSDLRWQTQNLRADRNDPTLATRPLGRVFGEMLNVLTLRERSDTFTLDDPMPGLFDALQITGAALGGAAGRLSRAIWGLSPLRRARRRRAQAIARNAKSALFVCLGNICRSPFAERSAKRRLPSDVRIESCGTYPVPDRRSPPEAVHVAEQMGVALADHRSRVITPEMLAAADAIAVFDRRNLKALRERWPEVTDRVFLLGSLRASGPEVLADPFRKDIGHFRSVYSDIGDCLAGWARLLGGEASN